MRRGAICNAGSLPMPETPFRPSRILIYLVVSLIAAAYLVPLLVVVLNSLRTAEEIAQTSMIGWPRQWAWGNYAVAWGDFCIAQTCAGIRDRKSTRLNSSHLGISYAVFCLKKKKNKRVK